MVYPLKNGGSFHGYVSHNQMVYDISMAFPYDFNRSFLIPWLSPWLFRGSSSFLRISLSDYGPWDSRDDWGTIGPWILDPLMPFMPLMPSRDPGCAKISIDSFFVPLDCFCVKLLRH